MKSFNYERPKTKENIVAALAEGGGQVRLLAGGTDLLTQIRSRLIQPELLVDVKGAEELNHLTWGSEGLSVGAAVILNRIIEEKKHDADGYAALYEAISDLASYALRNRATLVGNVTNASPCADTVPPLCVMDAEVEIYGLSGTRRLPIGQFIAGVRKVQLQPSEMVTRVLVPRPRPGTWSGFAKRKRVKGHDLALANVALLRDPERQRLRLSIGSCNPTPVLINLDDMFQQPDSRSAIQRAQALICPIDDVRASQEYRRDMVAMMVRHLFNRMAQAES
jgi:carbon-monoxide dehydrogenase medium subunit